MATSRVNITKLPQCRHRDVYVTYQTVAGGKTATCVNCHKVSTVKATNEEARNDLMRLIGDPDVK